MEPPPMAGWNLAVRFALEIVALVAVGVADQSGVNDASGTTQLPAPRSPVSGRSDAATKQHQGARNR